MLTLSSSQIPFIQLSEGWYLNIITQRIATITAPHGEIKTTYFGFEDKEKAEQFKQSIMNKKLCFSAKVRHSERLTLFNWEVKVWGCSQNLLDNLVKRCLA
ncbi:hypothetical protein [Gloeothece verrucosa]|uniref:Uncharacterized protein n=1 Tax=Gloeothece verrucosa (strain PCC 7822) TaxID=497965 RepID=E0UME0_GLOV7|nr:hypothetical protein [Gloeothece verrucosa]ADN18120.1 conserved hypothetical protein [Gloeothece verrucosa PCC 7822]